MKDSKNYPTSSWEEAGDWYDKIVGSKGHYYHEHLIFPRLLSCLKFSPSSSLLDLACGQGVLARQVPTEVSYYGIDASKTLIAKASSYRRKNSTFAVADVTQPLTLPLHHFTHGTLILAAQNIENPLAVFANFYKHLQRKAQLAVVLNHPCFRIPRQSGWITDHSKKLQSRRIDKYMTPMKIPILTHPGQREAAAQTLSFHHPLSHYSRWLKEAGFYIENIEEWCSDKQSSGKAAAMENRARKEFPLFLAILATAH